MLECRATVKNLVLLSLLAFTILYITYGYLCTNHPTLSREATDKVTTKQLKAPPAINIGPAKQVKKKTTEYINGLDNNSHSKDERGYVLAGDFWEQLSSGSRNLQNLQCWAGNLGVHVVEPFAVKSVLRTGLSRGQLTFSDLIDVDTWNNESSKLGNAQIVPWESFLKEAPREVIAVEFKYAYSNQVKTKQREMKQNPDNFPPRELRYKKGCSSNPPWPKESLIEGIGLKIIRRVCFNFEYGDALTLNEFTSEIYGTFKPNSTTVYFKQWRGLASSGRITVREAGCGNTGIQEHMTPSLRLQSHTDQYISKYLTHGTDSGFIAIIARLEKSKISSNYRPGIVPYCLKKTQEQWRALVTRTNLNKTFLSIDIGKYGSNSFKNTGKDGGNPNVEFAKFFKELYGNSWSIPEWENSFEDIGQTADTGYVALLQKMTVTRATCVIFVGGGSFQKHALTLYKSRMPESQWCIHIVRECTTQDNLKLHE